MAWLRSQLGLDLETLLERGPPAIPTTVALSHVSRWDSGITGTNIYTNPSRRVRPSTAASAQGQI